MKGSTKVFLALGTSAYLWFTWLTYFYFDKWEVISEGTKWEETRTTLEYCVSFCLHSMATGIAILIILVSNWDKIVAFFDEHL